MDANNTLREICPICGRILAEPWNKHHLLPLSEGGKGTQTIKLHKICHDKIHSVFTEKELAQAYASVSQIIQNEEMKRFIKWVRKQPEFFYDKSAKYKK